MQRENWSRKELIVAFNLYCKTPFTKINASNHNIKELAKTIGRSDSAVALKLANFARLDPALQQRNISGMSHGSKGEIEIWHEFNANWEELAFESERILSEFKEIDVDNIEQLNDPDFHKEGLEKENLVKIRVNQSFFRKTVLASYDHRCCITGIGISELLIASHIVPWSADKKNRINPCNGLCLNAFHDRAFDRGFITITPDFEIVVSEIIIKSKQAPSMFFSQLFDKKITLPQKFLPEKNFLEYHNKYIFKDSLA